MMETDFEAQIDKIIHTISHMQIRSERAARDIGILQIFLLADIPGIVSRLGNKDPALSDDVASVRKIFQDSFPASIEDAEVGTVHREVLGIIERIDEAFRAQQVAARDT